MKKLLALLCKLFPTQGFEDLNDLQQFINDRTEHIKAKEGPKAARAYQWFCLQDTFKAGLTARTEHIMHTQKHLIPLTTGLLCTVALAVALPRNQQSPSAQTATRYQDLAIPQDLLNARQNLEKDLHAHVFHLVRGQWDTGEPQLVMHLLDQNRTPNFKSTYPTKALFQQDREREKQKLLTLTTHFKTLRTLNAFKENHSLCISSQPKLVHIEDSKEDVIVWEVRRPSLIFDNDTIKTAESNRLVIVSYKTTPTSHNPTTAVYTAGPGNPALETGCNH